MDGWGIVYLIAVALGIGGVIVWLIAALECLLSLGAAETREAWWKRQAKAFSACVLFGAVYGAVFGVCSGPAVLAPDGEALLSAAVRGTTNGALLGGFGGGIAGYIGHFLVGDMRWTWAGVLGSGAPASGFFLLEATVAAWEPVTPERHILAGALVGVGVLLIGACLGVAADGSMRGNRTIIAGVPWLTAILKQADAA
jgi:hypothetical protein